MASRRIRALKYSNLSFTATAETRAPENVASVYNCVHTYRSNLLGSHGVFNKQGNTPQKMMLSPSSPARLVNLWKKWSLNDDLEMATVSYYFNIFQSLKWSAYPLRCPNSGDLISKGSRICSKFCQTIFVQKCVRYAVATKIHNSWPIKLTPLRLISPQIFLKRIVINMFI